MSLLQSLADALGNAAGETFLTWAFLIRLVVDLVCVTVLTRLIYYRHYRRGDLFLTFFAFNIVIFLIAFLLNRVEMTLGAAFGLFAVFSMLRYRTEDISAKDMTYMFLVIALGLLMAISEGGWLELVIIGGTVLTTVHLLEGNFLVRRELAQDVWYDDIKLIGAQSRSHLIDDLRARTGLEVHRVDVRQIDFLRDAAKLTVYYYAP
jgi:hypothetical protein